MNKPELLAPAGSREAFEAAVGAGADAVYLGAGEFNARRNADNFGADDLRAACRDAHLRGRKVYLTANTLVFPDEMDAALSTVASAAEAGVDAAIVQDVGLMQVLRRELPELELHTSTQMNIRDEAGVELAVRLGAARVTLARELTVEQIAALAKLGVDLECFVHGALCICQSGQCLLSSLIGGRSANRGLCAQPCRLPYKLVDERGKKLADAGQYLLSPKDLMGIDQLPRLIEAGVASLKIEGRMKSAEYVSTVTGVYRQALDRAWRDRESYQAEQAEKEQLSEAFSRGFSAAFLVGETGNDMMGYKRPNNRGRAVGRVDGFSKGRVLVNESTALEKGDLLEVWTKTGRVTYTVGKGDDVRPGNVRLSIKEPVSAGDRIFRVRSARLARACEQRTEQGMTIPVEMSVRVVIGQPLAVSVRDAAGHEARAEGPVVEPARTKAVTREDVIEHVGRLGGTPFACASWDVELSEGAGIGFSALHRVRKEALEAFENTLLSANAGQAPHAAGCLDFRGVIDMSSMSAFATAIDFSDTDIACELGQFTPGCTIGPKLYATNLEALQTWAALGATFAWLSPELTLHQIKLLCDHSPIPLGLVVNGRQELMVSDHCFLMAEGPCDRQCARCERRRGAPRFLEDRKGYRFPITTDLAGRGHLYNAVPLDVVHAIPDLLNAGVKGFAVDTTLMDERTAEDELNRVRRALKGKPQEKRENTTTGHLFRPVQ